MAHASTVSPAIVRATCATPELHRFGMTEPVEQAIGAILVHQEADAAAVHAADRHRMLQAAVQRPQHRAIAAQHDNDISLLLRTVAGAQLMQGLLRAA